MVPKMRFTTYDSHDQDCCMSAVYLPHARSERAMQAWYKYVHSCTPLPSLGTVNQLPLATQANTTCKPAKYPFLLISNTDVT